MATIKSKAVEAIEAGLVDKYQYRGNVQCIPVDRTIPAGGLAQNGVVELSAVLPPNTYVVGFTLYQNALGNTLDFGYTGDTDGLIDGADTSSASTITMVTAPAAVGGKKLVLVAAGAWTEEKIIVGNILIVTGE